MGLDNTTAIEETLSALNDLVRQGKVHYIGCSNLSVRQFAKALQISKADGWATFSSLQAYYNVAGRDLEYELLPFSRKKGLGTAMVTAGRRVFNRQIPAQEKGPKGPDEPTLVSHQSTKKRRIILLK